MHNLILGYAVGLKQEDVDLFCLSAIMSVKTHTDIVLFGTDIQATKSESTLVRIVVVPSTNIWHGVVKDPRRLLWACAYVSSKLLARMMALGVGCFKLLYNSRVRISDICNAFLHPALARYQLYRSYLSTNASNYDSVLISDVRDVYFQDDPFVKMDVDFATFLEIESSRCSQRTNRRWIKSVYGERIAQSMDNQRVICSGVSIGKASIMKKYLDLIIEDIGLTGRIPYADQGIHNVIIRLRKFCATLITNSRGLVLTAAGEGSAEDFVLKEDLVMSRDGRIFALVHQYDRHASLHAAIIRQHARRQQSLLQP